MPPDLDLTTLRLLVAIAELGSLSAAATHLSMGQPAASARVRAFEARWRLTVLRRSARGSSFTTDGQAVVTWARATLQSVDAMRAAVSALSDDRRTGVSIAASLTNAECLLPAWLGELHRRWPRLHPTLKVVNSTRVVELVRAQTVDVGFIEVDDRPDDLGSRTIGRDEIVVVVAPGHPWATARAGAPLAPDELAAAGWVLREEGSGTRETIERAVGSRLEPTLEASSTATLLGAALAGVGPAAVSSRAVRSDLDAGRLVSVPTTLDLGRPLTAVWHPDRRRSDVVAALLELAERDRT